MLSNLGYMVDLFGLFNSLNILFYVIGYCRLRGQHMRDLVSFCLRLGLRHRLVLRFTLSMGDHHCILFWIGFCFVIMSMLVGFIMGLVVAEFGILRDFYGFN